MPMPVAWIYSALVSITEKSFRFGTYHFVGSGSRPHQTYSSYQCSHGAKCSRPRACISKLRHIGFGVARSRRNGSSRGSFIEAFPLFGLDLNEYDELFAEKLELLLTLRDQEEVTWSGKFRPSLKKQSVYPRPLQDPLPIWLGVGGTPGSFVRAGALGMPLMVAVIGGETHRFRPLIDLYREAGKEAGHAPEKLKVGLHSLGYVSDTTQTAVEEYYPGYAETFTRIGKERGWPPATRERFEAQRGRTGAYLVGSPEEVAEKILRHSEALGGIARVTFQMDNAGLSHTQLLHAIELIGSKVAPLVNGK